MTFRKGSRWRSSGVLIAAILVFAACERKKTYPVSKGSKVKVELPSEPPLVSRDVRRKHPDGVFTVEGIMRTGEDVVGKQVKVRGVVLGLHPCVQQEPVEDTEGTNVKAAAPDPESCRPPTHFFLGDAQDSESYRLLVTGLSNQELEELNKGEEMSVEGLFDLMTRDGKLIRQAGLLILSDKDESEG